MNRFYFHFLSGIFVVYALGVALFLFFPEHFYRDLFINFLPYIIIGHLPIMLAYLSFHVFASEHKKISGSYLLFFICSIFLQSGFLIAPYFHTAKSFASHERQELKIISANVLKTNQDSQKTLDFLRAENPDVFGLIELTEAFAQDMSELEQDYPHQITLPYRDGFGIGLYSKKPLLDGQVNLLPGGIPFIDAFVEVEGRRVHLLLVHAMPPFTEQMFADRNASLVQLAELMDSSPTIVMGDFNLTPWSIYYKKFVNDSGLVSTRDMWEGLQFTWNSWGFHLPIDHMFLSRNIQVVKSSLGDDIGSDHLPLVAELALRDKE